MALTNYIRTSVAALGALAFVSQANAADIYSGGSLKDAPAYIPPPMWTGFYIGGHLGAAWANLDTNRNTFFDVIDNVDPGVGFGGRNLNSTGAFGGVQFGYNFQASGCCFVYGIEVDIGGSSNDSERTFTANTFDGYGGGHAMAVTVKSEGGFYGDATGRLGYTFGNALVYAKGGFAWFDPNLKVHAELTDAYGNIATFNRDNNNNTLTGWTVGAGLEWMLNPNWTLKVEYLHFDFSNDNNDWRFDANNDWRFGNHDLTIDTVKLGFNYLLSRPAAPIPLK